MVFVRALTRIVLYVVHVAIKCLSAVVFYRQNKVSSAAAADVFHNQLNYNGPKSFSEIPGPRAIPFFGSQWLYIWPGPYSLEKLHIANQDKFTKYGLIVRENHLWNFPIIHLYDKSDIEAVLRQPSKHPIRPELEAQSAYRRSRPDRYNSVGIVNAQGSEWHHLRSKLVPQLSRLSPLDAIRELCSISDELIRKIKKDCQSSQALDNFEKYVYRYGLEATVAVLLDQRLGTLKECIPPVAARLMEATDKLFEVSHDTMYGLPWWKYIPSKPYQELINCENTIYEVFADFVSKAKQPDIKTGMNENSYLDQILAMDDVDDRDKLVTLIDLVAAGIETTGNAAIFLLYNIISNPSVRKSVYEELDEIVPLGSEITLETMQHLPYLRACLTESLRLSPVAPNIARILEKPFIFQDYYVPAGTLVVCETWVACLQDSNFDNAKKFIPERWLYGETKSSPFLAIPFGVGRRMCPGKRLAEQEIMILTAKLLQNFEMVFTEPVEQVYKFLISPKGPVKVIFKERSSLNT